MLESVAVRAQFPKQKARSTKAADLLDCREAHGVLERFRAKWNPVRVKKTRQNKNLESFSVSMKR
jgi:hypothetical protein